MLSHEELLRFGQEHLFLNYRQPPIVMVRGEGSFLYDKDGVEYLDLSGGISVNALGHAHPRIAAVIAKQAYQLGHISNLFYNDKQNALAEALCARSFGERVFFCNSGAEANETAIKMARRYYYDRKETRYEVISALASFHGRTLATVTATGQPKYTRASGRCRKASSTCPSATCLRSKRRSPRRLPSSCSSRCRAKAASSCRHKVT